MYFQFRSFRVIIQSSWGNRNYNAERRRWKCWKSSMKASLTVRANDWDRCQFNEHTTERRRWKCWRNSMKASHIVKANEILKGSGQPVLSFLLSGTGLYYAKNQKQEICSPAQFQTCHLYCWQDLYAILVSVDSRCELVHATTGLVIAQSGV